MALVSDIVKRLDIPHEDGEWVEIRKLSWRQLELAAEIQTEDSLKRIKQMGGEMVQAMREMASDQERESAQQYDRAAILQAGIVRWSYEAEVTKENIDLLDEETAAWAFEEILNLTKPPSKEESKNA